MSPPGNAGNSRGRGISITDRDLSRSRDHPAVSSRADLELDTAALAGARARVYRSSLETNGLALPGLRFTESLRMASADGIRESRGHSRLVNPPPTFLEMRASRLDHENAFRTIDCWSLDDTACFRWSRGGGETPGELEFQHSVLDRVSRI